MLEGVKYSDFATFSNKSQYGGSESETKMLSIGILGDFNASNIFLDKSELNFKFGTKDYKHNAINLVQGFPLFYATKGTEIEWNPNFDKVSGFLAGSGISENDEINVMLSYAESGFGDNMSTDNNKYLLKKKYY